MIKCHGIFEDICRSLLGSNQALGQYECLTRTSLCNPISLHLSHRQNDILLAAVLDAVEHEFLVNRTVDPTIKEVLVNLPGWRGFNNPWMAEDEQETEYSYINLLSNPERYTGYKVGESTDAQLVFYAVVLSRT